MTSALTDPGLLGHTGYKLTPWADPGEAAATADAAQRDIASANGILVNPHLHHPWAWHAVTALTATLTAILGDAVAVENTFLIDKQPGEDFTIPPHQDGINDDLELDPARSLSVWLALTDAPTAAGCLELVPGSHLGGYLPYTRPATGARRPLTIADGHVPPAAAFAPVPVSVGQAIVFDVRLVHRSGRNTTKRPRIGLNIRYAAPNAFRRGTPAGRPGWLPITGDW